MVDALYTETGGKTVVFDRLLDHLGGGSDGGSGDWELARRDDFGC